MRTIITVKHIFNRIQSLNASSFKSMGDKYGVSKMHENIGDNAYGEVISNVQKDSLAYKILNSNNGGYSVKQLWVIAYELMKNESYVVMVQREQDEQDAEMYGCTLEEWLSDEE